MDPSAFAGSMKGMILGLKDLLGIWIQGTKPKATPFGRESVVTISLLVAKGVNLTAN
jgi:hypothetical protein